MEVEAKDREVENNPKRVTIQSSAMTVNCRGVLILKRL